MVISCTTCKVKVAYGELATHNATIHADAPRRGPVRAVHPIASVQPFVMDVSVQPSVMGARFDDALKAASDGYHEMNKSRLAVEFQITEIEACLARAVTLRTDYSAKEEAFLTEKRRLQKQEDDFFARQQQPQPQPQQQPQPRRRHRPRNRSSSPAPNSPSVPGENAASCMRYPSPAPMGGGRRMASRGPVRGAGAGDGAGGAGDGAGGVVDGDGAGAGDGAGGVVDGDGAGAGDGAGGVVEARH
jgi:hypothetical protein